MKKSVANIFYEFNAPLEGVCHHMYLDVKGLVTTGVGNLIDPLPYAKILPWRWGADGRLATEEEVEAEWVRVKGLTHLSRYGGGVFAAHTNLRLDGAAGHRVFVSKRDQMVAHLRGRFPEWDSYPADAQLAILSMAWALGPGFSSHGKFLAHLKAKNWIGCANECAISERGNPGVKPRNKHNRTLFVNSAAVVKWKMDPEELYWPAQISPDQDPYPADEAADAFDICGKCGGGGDLNTEGHTCMNEEKKVCE